MFREEGPILGGPPCLPIFILLGLLFFLLAAAPAIRHSPAATPGPREVWGARAVSECQAYRNPKNCPAYQRSVASPTPRRTPRPRPTVAPSVPTRRHQALDENAQRALRECQAYTDFSNCPAYRLYLESR